MIRDALASASNGSKPSLMIDANEFWSPKQAIRHITAIEREFDLVWAEEPVRRDDHRGLARVSSAVRTGVATGENLTAPVQFAPLVLNGAADVLQMGVGNVGITGALRIGEMADTFGLPVAMVNCPGRYAAHIAAVLPNHLMMEVLDVGRDAVFTTGHTIADGEILLGETPGIGLIFDEERLAEHAVDRPSAGPWAWAIGARPTRGSRSLARRAGHAGPTSPDAISRAVSDRSRRPRPRSGRADCSPATRMRVPVGPCLAPRAGTPLRRHRTGPGVGMQQVGGDRTELVEERQRGRLVTVRIAGDTHRAGARRVPVSARRGVRTP